MNPESDLLYFDSERFGPSPGDKAISDEGKRLMEIWGDIAAEQSHSVVLAEPSDDVVNALLAAYSETKVDNWDGYGAVRVKDASIRAAYQFLKLCPSHLPVPDVGVDPDGEVSFEWQLAPDRLLGISFGRDSISYAGLQGANRFYGVEIVRDEIPEAITFSFRRLFQEA